MLKRALIASAVLAITSSAAFANGGSFVPPPPAHVGAWYVGAAISGDASEFKTSGASASAFNFAEIDEGVLEVDPVPFATSFSNLNFDWASFGVNGQIYGGYGMVFQDHYTLAFEGFGEVDSQKGNFNTSAVITNALVTPNVVFPAAASARIKQNWELGLEIKPGVKLSDSTALYAMIGVGWAQFKLNDLGFGSNLIAAGVNPFFSNVSNFGILDGFPFSNNKTRAGLILGLGMSTMICPNVAVRGEYRWQRFGNINVSNAGAQFIQTEPTEEDGDIDGVLQTSIGSVRVKPTLQSFSLGLTYFFHAA